MSQPAATPPSGTPPPAEPPSARSSRRPRIAGTLLLVGSLGLIGSYFLPWVHENPLCDFPRYCGYGASRTGWAEVGIYLNPTTQDWRWAIQTLVRGDALALGMIAIFLLLYVAMPLALVWFGARMLLHPRPVRLRSHLLAVFGSLLALFMAQVLLLYSQLAFLEQGRPDTVIGYYIADVAAVLILAGSLVLPHVRRVHQAA